MALVKYGGGIIQASGSIAGNVFARNRFGNYVRPRTKPVNPQSTEQEACRAVMAFLTQYWKDTLTAGQRTAWETYAAAVSSLNKLGETINLTGFNHFIRSNHYLKRIQDSVVADGPTVLSLPEQDPVFAVTASEATGLISVSFDDTLDWDNETGGYLIVHQGVPQNPTRTFFNGPWRFMNEVAGVTGTPVSSPQTMTAPFTLVEGQKTWCYARILRADGRLTNPFTASCTIAA